VIHNIFLSETLKTSGVRGSVWIDFEAKCDPKYKSHAVRFSLDDYSKKIRTDLIQIYVV